MTHTLLRWEFLHFLMSLPNLLGHHYQSSIACLPREEKVEKEGKFDC